MVMTRADPARGRGWLTARSPRDLGRLREAQAAAEIESAGKAARAALKQFAADLALDLAAKRIQTRLDANTEAGRVDNFLTDLKQQGSKN